jgi:hypothetical protein
MKPTRSRIISNVPWAVAAAAENVINLLNIAESYHPAKKRIGSV